ncbi:hypothetical protein [Oceanicoccus sp. KOV_DT_Chl]|uniref:hypothetical protein n=1 Tax=Oceanicoccus sp. KOV_DT_Chl TaxID=1904639 RepID=UPI0011AF3DA8|nr:hypothetical protein [Oceanicoccus sp. KOV_DT_Chl]
MGGNPPDNNNPADGPESVQDYLDLLLTNVTEKPETQIDSVDNNQQVNSASMAASNVALISSRTAVRSFSSAGSSSRPQTWRADSQPSELKPYAEPSALVIKPLSLKTVETPAAPAPVDLRKSTEKVPEVKVATEVRPKTLLLSRLQR